MLPLDIDGGEDWFLRLRRGRVQCPALRDVRRTKLDRTRGPWPAGPDEPGILGARGWPRVRLPAPPVNERPIPETRCGSAHARRSQRLGRPNQAGTRPVDRPRAPALRRLRRAVSIDHRPADERGGVDSAWPRGSDGEPRPALVDVPAVAGRA